MTICYYLTIRACPGHWTLLPWITYDKVDYGSILTFSWIFLEVGRAVRVEE